MSRFRFSVTYFILAIIFFIIEVFIAMYVHDAIIRPYGGDFLVVILIYCFVRSFINTPVTATAIAVLLFAYAVEISQYFHLVNVLGLERSSLAKALLGTSFSFIDLLMYTMGTITRLVVENLKTSLKNF
jgi:hypothetical protein